MTYEETTRIKNAQENLYSNESGECYYTMDDFEIDEKAFPVDPINEIIEYEMFGYKETYE